MSFQPRPLTILLALVLAALAGRAGWADEAPRLRVVPDQIALQPGLLSQDIVITFEPGSKARVLDAQLRWFDTPGASVKLKSGPEPKPPTASDLAWTLNVAAGAQASKEAVLIFLLTYQLEPGAGAPARSAIATITAKVAYSGLTLQQSIKVTAVKGFDTLVAGKPKPAVLLVENSGLDDILLDKVDRRSPEHLTVTAAALPQKIPGRNTVPVPITIGTKERIEPGTAPLLLELSFSRPSDGDRAIVSVADSVQATIPGLSELKTALQVPTLLLLPGMLVVLTWNLLWPLAYREDGKEPKEFGLKFPSPGFWIVAFSLSPIIALLYSHFWTRDQTGLLETVSLQDVAIIWFGSIFAVGPALYFAGAAAILGVRKGQKNAEASRVAEIERQARARNPQKDDGPLGILGKLRQQVPGATLSLPAYNVSDGTNTQLLFSLGFGDNIDAQHQWVIPRIRVEPAHHLTGAVDKIIDEADLNELLGFLGQHDCPIRWDSSGPVKAPYQIEQAVLDTSAGRQPFVERG